MTSNEPVIGLIQRAVEAAIKEEIELEMKGVAKRVEDRVRGDVGRIAARVLEHFSFERYGADLRIHVKFDLPNTTTPNAT